MIFAIFAATLLGAPPCAALPGAGQLFANSRTHVVWVGELHGTREDPALFADMVCAAAMSGRPVIVALERTDKDQPAFDVFMKSDGDKAAEEALLKAPSWNWPNKDGRTSLAILDLVKRLRRFTADGQIVSVKAIDRSSAEPDTEEGARDRRMADEVKALEKTHPAALVMVYSGNTHAQKTPVTFDGKTYPTAASVLPSSEVVSVYLVGGSGSAWNCQNDGCKIHSFTVKETSRRGVRADTSIPGFDYIASTGLPTTASFPAIE